MTEYSRRDWFRLRPAGSDLLGSDESGTLRAVEEPPNHDGMNLSQLPPLREAWLSADQVRSLFADIQRLATQVRLMAKTRMGKDQSVVLQAACTQLLTGQVAKLQVRYTWDQAQWIDTLERQPHQIRLVRIKHSAMS